MDEQILLKAKKHLSRRDAVLRPLIREVGPCTLRHNPDHFEILVRSIVSQQISTKAAIAISNRLMERVGRFQPKRLLAASDDDLRAAGLSRGKQLSIRDLAEKCASGAVPLKKLAKLEDAEVVASLTQVRGIGPWTAEMFLIFSLGRLDVLPVGDYGLRAGVQKHYALAELPKKDTLHELTESWKPYRSIGTWYIWRSLGGVPQSD
ncbi:MAG: DNA-3-methyladenine glycosylase 2 family protein [Planctomycetes bacterium]|jgi:DNA-3-methyladenine glycosylase II|nr:DNA-3-methyladenine glycosylase 2 family protein [Planctomycetota bacterium]